MRKVFIPKMTLRVFRNLILISVFATALFWSGYSYAYKEMGKSTSYPEVTINREVPDDKNLDFSLFWRVWDLVDQNYYDNSKVIPAKMVYGAIKGMVAAVDDPYTIFLTPSENKITEEDLQGNFSGVGIQIGFVGTQLAVVAPLPDSPAEDAGVQAGDYIVAIKDEQKDVDRGTVGITLPEAVEIIRGPVGSKVTLALTRENEPDPILVDITRKSIEIPSVTLNYVGDSENVAHLRILKFGADTKNELDSKIIEIQKKEGLAGIVLDMRNNPGGYLQGAVDIGGEFIDPGKVVVSEDRPGSDKIDYKAEGLQRLKNMPIVVLVNKGSASASEILAGALRDQNGTKIIGTTTFGKGTIQERQEFEEGVALHITSARWLTPNGTWVNGVGLKPDIEVADNYDTPQDEQLSSAIDALLTEGVR